MIIDWAKPQGRLELDAGRALGLESRTVLQQAAASPFAHSRDRLGFAVLLGRILRHPELELRVFLCQLAVLGIGVEERAAEDRVEPVEVNEHGESNIEHHPAQPYGRGQAKLCPVQ